MVCLPLRFASASVTASRRSSSSSLRCFTAFGKSLGKTCRLAFADEAGFVAGGDVFSTPTVEKGSDLPWLVGSRPMCRDDAVEGAGEQVSAHRLSNAQTVLRALHDHQTQVDSGIRTLPEPA